MRIFTICSCEVDSTGLKKHEMSQRDTEMQSRENPGGKQITYTKDSQEYSKGLTKVKISYYQKSCVSWTLKGQYIYIHLHTYIYIHTYTHYTHTQQTELLTVSTYMCNKCYS